MGTISLDTPTDRSGSSSDQAERLLEDLVYTSLLRQRILATYAANEKYISEMLKLPVGYPTNF